MDSRAGPKDGGCFEQAEVRRKKALPAVGCFFHLDFFEGYGIYMIYIYTHDLYMYTYFSIKYMSKPYGGYSVKPQLRWNAIPSTAERWFGKYIVFTRLKPHGMSLGL